MAMSERAESFAIIGLGRMGANLARQSLDRGMAVVGLTLGKPPADLTAAGMRGIDGVDKLRAALAPPRAVFLYIPAGPAVDQMLDALAAALDPGDVIVDGGNSYWGDSIRRHRRLADRGLHFVDLGTSGGVDGARHGACFMAGGDRAAIARVEPILRRLAVDGGYVHAGPPGAGHFVKLVHNGIEFGMLQAIGEGIDLLDHYREPLPIADVLECWRHGSVIRSWLVDLMAAACREAGGLDRIEPYVEDTGEVNCLVDDALHMEVAIPVITQSVIQLLASRDSRRNAARAVAMMRHGFGNHPYGRNDAIRAGRRESRVGGSPANDNGGGHGH